MHVADGVWPKTLSRNILRNVTSCHGDHAAACVNELSLPFKLLVIEKNPSVLWLNYDFNINKTGIFAIHFYFFVFFQC